MLPRSALLLRRIGTFLLMKPAGRRVTSWTLSLRNDKGSVSDGPKTCGQISRGATLSLRNDKPTLLGHVFQSVVFGNLSLRNDELPENAACARRLIEAAGHEPPASG